MPVVVFVFLLCWGCVVMDSFDSGKCLCTLFMGLIPLSCFGTKFNRLHLERYVGAKSGLIWLWQSTSVQDCKSSFLIDLHWDSTKSFNGGYCCIKSCFFSFVFQNQERKMIWGFGLSQLLKWIGWGSNSTDLKHAVSPGHNLLWRKRKIWKQKYLRALFPFSNLLDFPVHSRMMVD